LGAWSDIPQVQAALDVNVLFLIGAALRCSCGGLPQHPPAYRARRRDSSDAARAMASTPTPCA